MEKDPILQTITIGNLKINNRIYMPAMHLGMADNFEVTEQLIKFYIERARGGVGLICVGYATIDEFSGNSQNIGAHNDKFVDGLSKLANAIKSNGAKASIQLNHAGRYNLSIFMNGKSPVAPSPIASKMTKEIPKELSEKEIKKIIESFALAALRAKVAGFDAVEILSGTGYLISEFLSPLTNKRNDKYGGTLKNRMRFGLEIIEATRGFVGEDYPIIVRMNGNDFMPGGNGREELKIYAEKLEKASVNALCINVGWHEARVPQIVSSVPPGAFAYLARGIKERVKIPVIASHRINDPNMGRELISDSMCDMVAMGRSLIVDPMLPKKITQNLEDTILHCTGCAQGCFDNLFKLKHVECICNPRVGHETDWVKRKKTDNPKRIVVVGGGPAGINAALGAFYRGHYVTLYENDAKLGGQLLIAGIPSGREEFSRLADELGKKIKSTTINVKLNKEVDELTLENANPDKIIVATGAKPFFPTIPGVKMANVISAWDLLRKQPSRGNRIIIIGGGSLGIEIAIFLASKGTLTAEAMKFLLINRAEDPESLLKLANKGTKQVTLVEKFSTLGRDMGKSTRWSMIQDLKRLDVKIMIDSKVKQITNNGVILEYKKNHKKIKCDTVVLASGAISYNPLQPIIEKIGIPFEVVGDAVKVATVFEAVHGGYNAGIKS